jgi:hypothetical protein
MGSGISVATNLHQREELMDTSTSAAPDEKTPPTQLGNENSKPSGPLEISAERISSSVARLTSNSIDELQGLLQNSKKCKNS